MGAHPKRPSSAEGLGHSSFAVRRPCESTEAGLVADKALEWFLRHRAALGLPLGKDGGPWRRSSHILLFTWLRFIVQTSATFGLGGPGRFRHTAAGDVNKQRLGHRKRKVKYVMFRSEALQFLGWDRLVERPRYCRGRPPGTRSSLSVGH